MVGRAFWFTCKAQDSLEDICIVSTVRLENIEISHFKILIFPFNFYCTSKSEKCLHYEILSWKH